MDKTLYEVRYQCYSLIDTLNIELIANDTLLRFSKKAKRQRETTVLENSIAHLEEVKERLYSMINHIQGNTQEVIK
jgi:hypothetical protein